MLRTGHGSRALQAGVALVVLALLAAAPARAAQEEPDDAVSQAVVQPIPNLDTMTLNAALVQLGRNPRDVGALVDAGRAAMTIGDVDAAVGFFRRAQQLSPTDPRVKAGLAGALVRNGDPFSAIPLFDEAEAAGASDAAMAADRGLAYDLVGDNARAQRYYRQAIALSPSDEVLRRLAISLAMTGDRRSADGALAPLLARQDKAAQRTRAFVYAILGQPEEAVAIANTTMPADLAAAMAPYLRYMRTLTRPQQAAAANLGVFPRASEIGREDPRMAAFAPPKPPVVVAAAPVQPARGRRSNRDRIAQAEPARERRPGSLISSPAPPAPQREVTVVARPAPPPVAVAAPVPPPEPVVAREVELPPIDTPPPAPRPAAEPVRVALADPAPAPAPVTPAPVPAASTSAPGFTTIGQGEGAKETAAFDLAATRPTAAAPQPAPVPIEPAPAAPVPVVAPPPAVSAPPPAPQPARSVSLAEAFSDFVAPVPRDTAPVPGAVDIRRIQPVRDGAAATAGKPGTQEAGKPGTGRNARAPAPPSHPSRIWVQVATGRDKAALAFDWRRMMRQAATALRDKRGHVSAWGQTNRLLTGPFPSEAAANAFIAQLRRADIDDAFVWTSPAGQVVDVLGGK